MGFSFLKAGRRGGKQAIALDSLGEMVVTGKDTETDFRHILEYPSEAKKRFYILGVMPSVLVSFCQLDTDSLRRRNVN